jgi:hypothetical protein
MQTIEKEVKVTELLVGDKLCGSGAVITHAPYDSVKCPRGRIHVGVKYPTEDQGYQRTWNKSTTIKIQRNASN